jgi:hypothetical protein
MGHRTATLMELTHALECSAANPAAHQASIESLGLLAEIATSADVTAPLGAKENASA